MKEETSISLSRLLIKTTVLFLIFNSLCFLITFFPYGNLTLYNSIFTGRDRLPFGDNPSESYNITINNIDAMVASHKIAGDKKHADEFRIIVIGDSSIWGFLQNPDETLTGLITAKSDTSCQEKRIEVFNIGYPSLSILKDLALLDKVTKYHPDLVLWFITLESMVKKDQMTTPLIENNPDLINTIISTYDLDYQMFELSLWDRSLFKQRRNYADIIKLQFYGLLWSATGIDQAYPETYNPAQRDFKEDFSFKDFKNRELYEDDLAFDVIKYSIRENPGIDFIIINEPILISKGKNSDIRYNYYYPKWAYDRYREILNDFTIENGIKYFDFWNLVSENHFTNSAIHLDAFGEQSLANEILNIMDEYCENK